MALSDNELALCPVFPWPFLLSLAILAIAALLAFAPMATGLSALHLLWSVPLAAVVATLLVRKPGDRFHVYLLDDWSAAYDPYPRSASEKLNQRRKAFAEALKQKIEASNADEVVIVARIVLARFRQWRRLPTCSVCVPIFWQNSPCRCSPSAHA